MRQKQFLYDEVSEYVATLIENEVLQPGDRVPSLREIARSQNVSLATATLAYQNLEDGGYIRSRPKSGFYVLSRSSTVLEEPEQTNPPGTSQAVTIRKPIIRLLEYASDLSLQPLGCAIPSADLLSTKKLDFLLSQKARKEGHIHNTYSTPQGDVRLRKEIARRTEFGRQAANPENFVITNGCTEALIVALQCVTKPGDTVAVESPTYFGLLQILETLNLRALELPTSKDGVDLDALKLAIDENKISTCLFSSSFNNPLGCTMPNEKRQKLLSLLNDYRIPLIEDDIYGDIHFGEVRPKPFISFESGADVIYCSSFSKSLAPGYRVGWLYSTNHNISATEAKFALSLCCPTLPQAALASYLASGDYDRHLQKLRMALKSNIEHTTKAIGASFPVGTKVSRPAGGFVLWVELTAEVDMDHMFEEAIKTGICFAPGDLFSTTENYQKCMRISCGHAWSDQLENAIFTLAELVRRNSST